MLRWVFVIWFGSVFLSSEAQKAIKTAPPNPGYIQFLEAYSTGREGEYRAAPSPYKLNFDQYFLWKKYLSPKTFPIVYDMRSAGPGGTSLLTSVKHQLSCGACWAFATYGSIESAWKIQGLGDHDLSENNLKNCHGFDLDPCQWGHHFMSTAYLVRGSGPISEANDPYNPINESCTPGLTPEAYIPISRYLPEDHDAFKEMIMNTGAVYNTYRSVSAGYEWINGHYTYCYQGPGTTSHAIAIVGWNDTITTACGNGAWICKNEYGTNFGEDGFFYISYQDTLVLKYNAIWPEREEYDPEMIVYQYDTIGGWPFVGYEDPVAYGLIRFTSTGEQFIDKIGTYTVSFGSYIKVDIYDDFDGTELTNLLGGADEAYCDYPGFWQIELNEPVKIGTDEDFFVLVKYTSPGEDFPMAIEAESEGYTAPSIETGKCWVSPDGEAWEAVGLGTAAELDLCIKTFAYETTRINLQVFLEGPFNGSGMNAHLNSVLPLSHPYSSPPWNYEQIEQVAAIPASDIVDWVLVELRETDGTAETATAEKVIGKRAFFIQEDGIIVGPDGLENPEFLVQVRNNLYTVVYHRNHLPVMSAEPLIETNGIYNFNFTDGIEKAYNSGQKELGNGYYGMIGGDGNISGIIDILDKTETWESESGENGYQLGDYNLDRQVSNPDKNQIWVPNQGSSKQVPE